MERMYFVQVGRITRAGNLDAIAEQAVRVDAEASQVRRHFEERYAGLAVRVLEAKVETLEIPKPQPHEEDKTNSQVIRRVNGAPINLTAEEKTEKENLDRAIYIAEAEKKRFFERVASRMKTTSPWISEIYEMKNVGSYDVRADLVLRWNVIKEVLGATS